MGKSDLKLLKKQNELLYELKNLFLWLNFCNEDFEEIRSVRIQKAISFNLIK